MYVDIISELNCSPRHTCYNRTIATCQMFKCALFSRSEVLVLEVPRGNEFASISASIHKTENQFTLYGGRKYFTHILLLSSHQCRA